LIESNISDVRVKVEYEEKIKKIKKIKAIWSNSDVEEDFDEDVEGSTESQQSRDGELFIIEVIYHLSRKNTFLIWSAV